MARGAAISVQNQFTKGLITEQSVINFPENAVTDADNCVFSELGPVTRRLGIDYENDFAVTSGATINAVSMADAAFTEYKWFFSTATGTINFVVQQIGNKINFFLISSDAGLSSQRKSFYVDLTAYKVSTASNADVNINPCSFSSGKGYLFICHPLVEPIAVQYNQDTDTITVTQITIEIRDFEGVEDGLDTETRPTSLSNLHKYNLYNQGWYADLGNGSQSGTYGIDGINAWVHEHPGDYPSNVDVWWYYTTTSTNTGREYFNTGGITQNTGLFGNTPAPKGHYIYNAFDVDRSAKTGIPGVTRQTSGGARPSSTVFYAGRIFYGGISANAYSDKLYFSQIIESDDQFGRCFQSNDPTSKQNSDLLDSDGGEILLPQIERIIGLHVLGDALIVLGSNGIFSISGNDNGPFRATNFTVSVVSTVGVLSQYSIVNTDGSLVWINSDALYTLSPSQLGNSFQVQNISKATIQSFLNDIPSENKSFIKGSFNRANGIIQWLMSDSDLITGYRYNRVLELNTISSAFYPYKFEESVPYVVGIISVSGQGLSSTQDSVTMDNGDPVTTDSGDPVIIQVNSYISSRETFKYATSGGISSGTYGFTYSTITNTDFIDWKTYDNIGKDYDSYFVIGYRIRGDILRPTQVSPVEIVLQDDGDSEIVTHGIWDYGFRTTNPLWLYGPQRVIDSSRGWTRGSYRLRRVRFRGKGRSFQMRFDSDGRHSFEVLGWSTYDTGGQTP